MNIPMPVLKDENTNKCIMVRVKTSYWHDKRGMYSKKSILFLRRKCRNVYNAIEEDCNCIGAEEAAKLIVNFNEVNDGIYYIIPINPMYDYETGVCEGCEYKLVECTEQ